MTLKVKFNYHNFQCDLRESQSACLVQLWWFQLKYVTSYRADNVKFMGGHTDGRMANGINLFTVQLWNRRGKHGACAFYTKPDLTLWFKLLWIIHWRLWNCIEAFIKWLPLRWCPVPLIHIRAARSLFYWFGWTLIPACISDHIPSKVWDEITFPKLNGCIVEVWERINEFTPHFTMDKITYLCWDWSLST